MPASGLIGAMSERRDDAQALADATERLARAEHASDTIRLELLEELHASLERELEADETGSTGR